MNTDVNWQRDIIDERRSGLVRAAMLRPGTGGMKTILPRFGLAPNWGALVTVSAADAERLSKGMLAIDLAYGIEVMPLERAAALAAAFVADFADARFYTNVSPSEGQICEWTAYTESTFDAGILAVGLETAGCVWIEDED